MEKPNFLRWDLERLEHGGSIGSLTFSPDGDYLIVGSNYKATGVYKVPNGEIAYKLLGHGNRVIQTCFSSDGRYLLTHDGWRAHIWDFNQGKKVSHIASDQHYYYRFFHHSPYSLLRYYTIEDRFELWNFKEGKKLRTSDKFPGDIKDVHVFPNDQHLLVRIQDGYPYIIDIGTGKTVAEFHHGPAEESPNICDLMISPFGDVVVFSLNRDCIIWNIHNNTTTILASMTYPLVFTRGGRVLATRGYDRHVKIWDLSTLKCIQVFNWEFDGYPSQPACDFSPDGRWLAIGSENTVIMLDWNPKGIELESSQYSRLLDDMHSDISSIKETVATISHNTSQIQASTNDIKVQLERSISLEMQAFDEIVTRTDVLKESMIVYQRKLDEKNQEGEISSVNFVRKKIEEMQQDLDDNFLKLELSIRSLSMDLQEIIEKQQINDEYLRGKLGSDWDKIRSTWADYKDGKIKLQKFLSDALKILGSRVFKKLLSFLTGSMLKF